MKRYLLYSDTHLNFTLPWTQYNFVAQLKEENPDGLILTGDIACGLTIEYFLSFIVKQLKIPIYFVLGNHDFYSRSIKDVYSSITKLCSKYSNLHWMNNIEHLSLKENEVGIIGHDGWYDGRIGNPIYLGYNLDWIMIEEFRKLKSFDEKFAFGQNLANKSTEFLKIKLEKALEIYQTVYILTHMPICKEASRGVGSGLEEFWLPYNVNCNMGKMIEDMMKDRNNQKVIVVCGHVHVASITHVAHNIECIVQAGKYLGGPTEHNTLYI